jgi:hypothetical protein
VDTKRQKMEKATDKETRLIGEHMRDEIWRFLLLSLLEDNEFMRSEKFIIDIIILSSRR